ncbi:MULTISPECIES: complex I NDUFA9 subunit family protein [unclassified Chelatococcus]|uniref:complex I NDUFA9 subunit family protein n=1 Tax=unclassified Chelatococcus TaxID=2638111 RepID=UPI001BCC1E8C|nr:MULTISPECIES: complex I NDUFA9 subunit family protein [unclassified Chelatococcus]CAH1656664.1 NADH dehydrogenase [Hyphomicrobiales bacterium]MBS7740569.1 complex I NDUFA9 subunit family protein [Chelatococcus sp. HY11]MBX3544647.1 complex I NDUFA9 subunit family protein [Chelatococcus sp.]MCO5078188.1 complex I NDUFA9 subunit family protein [Chelatococcus sp.]CAH1684668.1 NADH dehydrogenase [Hyphomicrobiales bacterium]
MTAGVVGTSSQLITVFGGSGFIGRHVVRALAQRGYRIRVAVRRPDLAGFLQPLGRVGQIHAVQANLRYKQSVQAAARGSDVVINLVGVLKEAGRQNFAAVHSFGARAVAEAAEAAGARLVHVSALGADAQSESLYARTKAAGEAAAFSHVPKATILRPSVVFGPEDGFFNRFAALGSRLPVVPITGGATRFQPVYVMDVAEAIARVVDGAVAEGHVYELGGPEVKTLREIVDYTLGVIGRRRLVVDLPKAGASLMAGVVEFADKLTFGILPDYLVLTRDQVALLGHDNVVSTTAIDTGRTLGDIGVTATPYEAIVPGYLWRYRRSGQFADIRTI